MTGAIIGDIIGSRFEFHNHKGKDFNLFTRINRYTDDTVMTIAVAKSLLESDKDSLYNNTIINMHEMGRRDLGAGYGGNFKKWILNNNPTPYGSYGNGSAMRISPAGWVSNDLNETGEIAKIITETTHNHEEGIKGGVVIAQLIYLARNGKSKEELRDYASQHYNLDFTLKEIRPTYKFYVSCMKSVPQAIVSFLESSNFEDAIRNAISIGGDSDTIGAITGSIAESYYGIPIHLVECIKSYIPKDYKIIINEFENKYGNKIIGG